MRLRNTLILLLLLLGLGAYVYFVEYPAAQQETKKKTLFDFKVDEVTQIALTYPDREIVLKKTGDEWVLVKPIETEADETIVKTLVNGIADCEVKKTVEEEPTDLSIFGLDAPATRVKVSLGERELPEILVGKTAPIGSSAYIQRVDEKKVLLASSAFRSGVDKKVKDLRNKTILRFSDEEVRRIALQGDGKDLALVKKDDQWQIERPAAFGADGTVVRSYLSTLRSLRAIDFPDDEGKDLSAYGLDAPRLSVTLWVGKDEDQRQVLIGKENEKKELFVKTGARPVVYTVSDWVYRDLNKTLNDLRDKVLLAVDKEKATAIEVKRADGTQFKLMKEGDNKWVLEKAEGKLAENAVTQFVNDVAELKGYEVAADDVADLKSFGLDPAAVSMHVGGEGGAEVGTILLGQREREGKKEYTGARAGGTTVFLVRDYLYSRLDKQARDFIEQPTPTAAPVTPGVAPDLEGDTEEDEGEFDEEDFDEEEFDEDPG